MKPLPKRILLSARDPGATDNIIQLFRLLETDKDFDPVVVASSTASHQMTEQNFGHIPFTFSAGQAHVKPGQDPSILLKEAESLYADIQPDIVVVSLSSFGAGIDEALIAVSKVPVFAFQDFWGDVNDTLGKCADLYFVLDKNAEILTRKKFNVRTTPIGMPKYLKYRDVDFQTMRLKTRQILGLTPSVKLIGWFGQSPAIKGHSAVFNSFVQVCLLLGPEVRVVIKEHPKFINEADAVVQGGYGTLTGKICTYKTPISTDALLSACDLVVTPFSLCGLDHAAMNSFSPDPMGTVVYLMNNSSIRQFARDQWGMVSFPIVENQGVGQCIRSDDISFVANFFTEEMTSIRRKIYHQNSKSVILSFDYNRFKQILLHQEMGNE